jgi:hypothetical protein
METIDALKYSMIVIMFFIIYIGMIPAFSNRCRKSETTLSLLNCFAGGVFLAMTLIHIMPEAVETYESILLK